MDEPAKDDCKFCDLVLVGVGLAVSGILAFMAIDLATGGKLSSAFSRPLAQVIPLGKNEAGDSDAG